MLHVSRLLGILHGPGPTIPAMRDDGATILDVGWSSVLLLSKSTPRDRLLSFCTHWQSNCIDVNGAHLAWHTEVDSLEKHPIGCSPFVQIKSRGGRCTVNDDTDSFFRTDFIVMSLES